MRSLTVVSSRAIEHARACEDRRIVDGLDGLAAVLVASPAREPTTLDLVGHSTRGHHYLRLGRDAIDLLDPAIARRIVALVAQGRLDHAGICQIRLLGCATAVGPAARWTLRRLASLTGRVVFGTTKPLMDVHHGPRGFRPELVHLLVEVRPCCSLGWTGRAAVSSRADGHAHR